MALGIVLIKKADIGVSPVSTVPAALSNVTSLSFGMTTNIYQAACFIAILLLNCKNITLKTILILPIAIIFGFIIDFYMFLLAFGNMPFWLECIVCFGGIVCTALGITLINRAKLMLTPPDALIRDVSEKLHKKYSFTKVCGDISYVAIAAVIELIFLRQIVSINIGTLASMLLTGTFVGWISKSLYNKT